MTIKNERYEGPELYFNRVATGKEESESIQQTVIDCVSQIGMPELISDILSNVVLIGGTTLVIYLFFVFF